MLQGPWKEASSPVVNLLVDDKNVNGDAISVALAYLYGHHPKLDDDNAFRVLAAASFLDLQVFFDKFVDMYGVFFFLHQKISFDLNTRGFFFSCRICVQYALILLFQS